MFVAGPFSTIFRLAAQAGLLLGVQWCGAAPPHRESAVLPITARQNQEPPVALAPLIRALLDTAAAGSTQAADARRCPPMPADARRCPPMPADARRGLQAGAGVRALYGLTYAPAWTTPTNSLNASTTAALALLARAAEYGLRPTDYGTAHLQALRDSLARPATPERRASQQARLEICLTDAVLSLMRDLNRGRLHPYTPSVRERAGGVAENPAAALRAALAGGTVPAAMLAGQPTNREYRQLQQALARWLALPGAPDSAVQHEAQYQQAALNLERWRWETDTAATEYVLINIPAAELLVVAHDPVRRRHRVVVGTPATPTPTLSNTIRYFTLAPDWHVPRSIATKEMLPHLKKDAGYLARGNYALYDARGRLLDPARIRWAAVTAANFAYTIRQSAGCENALGNIVFRFANPYSVYLHDTPFRQYFARPYRALSHGCIRLERPLALAAYLLRREGNPAPLPGEEACARQPRPHDMRLRRPVSIRVRYATCTVEEHGRLRFWPDVYGRDEAVRRALFGPAQ